LTENIDY